MPSLRVATSAEFPFPASKVWRLIAGFNTLPDYHAAIASSELLEGGAVRELVLTEAAGGGSLHERLVYFDDQAMEFHYRIVRLIDCPLPFRNYLSIVRLESIDANNCRLHWGSNFDAEGATDSDADAAATGIYQGGFDGIRQALSSASPSDE